MTQSKSFNNLLKNSRLKLIPEEEGDQLQTHFEEFNKKRKESMVKELELERINNLKPQNKYMGVSHYSSIHKCKPNCQECITTNVLKNTGRFQTMEAEEHYENYTSNKSSSSCERIETVTNGFATYSNISAVPNHAEDYAYSSVDEMANIIMNNKGNHEVKPNKAKKRQSRYNDSFGVNEFHLDTSPDSYLFNEGCYTRPTPKLSQNHTKMISEIKRTHGSKSTKNLHVNSFLNPKKTVSINLFGNESDEDIHKSGISEKSNSRVNIEGSQNYHNSSKFSTLKKPMKFAKPQKSSNNVSLAKKNKFFQRKSTLEASPNMTAFTKQLQEAEKQAQKAEKKLSCANRKASQEMSEVKNKIQTLKDQFIQHRKDNYTSKVKKSQTPTGLMNQNKSRSRMKYLQSKSRNNKSHLSDSKTSDLRSRRNTYKPFSSKMIQNFNKTTLTKSRPSTKRMSSSKNSSYLDTLYKKTRKKLVSTLKDRNSVESITTDKTIRRNENKLTDSTNNLSSSSQEDHYPTVKHRNELMYIQEEQEYTESQNPTNEADLILESSCH